jgi:hypothetical protein
LADGVIGCAIITATVANDTHPDASFLAVTLYVPAENPLKLPNGLLYVPVILKFKPTFEELTIIEPVLNVQVGCVSVTVGAAGIIGNALITAVIAGETHPPISPFAVTL